MTAFRAVKEEIAFISLTVSSLAISEKIYWGDHGAQEVYQKQWVAEEDEQETGINFLHAGFRPYTSGLETTILGRQRAFMTPRNRPIDNQFKPQKVPNLLPIPKTLISQIDSPFSI